MRAPISVLIPTLNAEQTLPHCLLSLSEGLSLGLIRDLTISDGGSQDGTCRIADAVGAVVLHGPGSRGGQLRRGAAATQGDWLLVLHADTRLEPGWSDVVAQAIATPGACYFHLAFDVTGFAPRWVAGWANLRSRLFGIPYGDQGLLIDRATYEKLGPYPDIQLMEDVALARALRGRLRPLAAIATTSAEKFQRQGWLRRGCRNLWTLTRYFAGADPARLAAEYRR